MKKWDTIQGNIHVLRKHKGGREGVSQMLTFAYGGGGPKGSCLRNHSLEKRQDFSRIFLPTYCMECFLECFMNFTVQLYA